VLLSVFFSFKFVPQNPSGAFWNANPHWYRFFLRYDSGWYLTIARHGYSYTGDNLTQQSVTFYPLYPLLSRLLHNVFGIDYNAAVLLVANISIVLAIIFLYQLVSEDYGKRVALYTVTLLSFFPTAFFFSAGYTESLSLLLIVATLWLLKHQRFLLACCCAGLATGTRSTGVILLLPILWELWRHSSGKPLQLIPKAIGYSLLATSGLWLYMIYLWKKFGSPMVFAENLRAWELGGQNNDFVSVLTLRPFFDHLDDIFYEGPLPNAIDPWIFLAFFVLLIWFRKRISVSYFLFALGVLLLPYVTRSGGSLGFQSFLRYLVLAFPVFIIIADLVKEKTWAVLTLVGLFGGMLFMYSAMFAQWYWIG
jgi:Dolichyl-phosphate-mannose-protein mannosyltransferase